MYLNTFLTWLYTRHLIFQVPFINAGFPLLVNIPITCLPSAGNRLSWTFRLYQSGPYDCVLITHLQAGAALGAFVLDNNVDKAGFFLDGVFFAFIHTVPAAGALIGQDVIGHEFLQTPALQAFCRCAPRSPQNGSGWQ